MAYSRLTVVGKSANRSALLLNAAAFALLTSAPAAAATFVVDATADAIDIDPGDGVCASARGGCTLRAAVMEANALAGADLIQVAPGYYTLTIAGGGEDDAASGDLDILDEVVIEGLNPFATTIDADGLDRIFHVGPNTAALDIDAFPVTLRGLRVTKGSPPGFGTGGGGILNMTHLTLDQMLIVDNESTGAGGGVGTAGGPFVSASLNVNLSIISFNRVTHIGDGGGVSAGSLDEMAFSAIIGNYAYGGGGGLAVSGGSGDPGLIFGTTVYGNSTSGNPFAGGGGIYGSYLEITHSDISHNLTGEFGGDFINASGGGLLISNSTIANSTIRGNLARQGGGISSSGNLTLQHVTIVENGATQSLLTDDIPGAGLYAFGSEVEIQNSIVANNSQWNCWGEIVSLGNNLANEGTCDFDAGGDENADPQLGAYGLNGGPTRTVPLLAGSPAVNGGANIGFVYDQRGVDRPQGGVVDKGAYELELAQNPKDGRCDVARLKAVGGEAAMQETLEMIKRLGGKGEKGAPIKKTGVAKATKPKIANGDTAFRKRWMAAAEQNPLTLDGLRTCLQSAGFKR